MYEQTQNLPWYRAVYTPWQRCTNKINLCSAYSILRAYSLGFPPVTNLYNSFGLWVSYIICIHSNRTCTY